MSAEELFESSDRRTTGTRRKLAKEGPSAVVAILVVEQVSNHDAIGSAIALDEVELSFASTIDQAVRAATTNPPDVVLVGHDLIRGSEVALLTELREAMPGDVAVILLEAPGSKVRADDLERMGASAALATPLDPVAFQRLLLRLESVSGRSELRPLGSVTVAELVNRAHEELRRGLLGALRQGATESVDLGEGSELLASLWNAIGRMRASLIEHSGGRVSFGDSPEVPLITLTETRPATSPEELEPFLEGYTVLIADDDPSVLWFFSGLFREAGARVLEAIDGEQALVTALRQTPDLIVADILMPRLDGLGLCHALRRDPILDAVPVILLSWKEDFLERMRELRAGAEAYLRKEASGQQILDQVERILEPRLRLEPQLQGPSEVRGRTERVGLAWLLRAVRELRPDALVSIRDAWSLFELTYRQGHLVDATRTAIDGSFVRGAQALRSLVGAGGGRFVVTKAQSTKSFETDLDGELESAIDDVRDAVDALRPSELRVVGHVELDPAVLRAFLKSSPPDVASVAEQLASGRSPGELIDAGTDAELVESVLLAFARRAGVSAVRGLEGEDRISLASARRAARIDSDDLEQRTSTPSAIDWHPTTELAPDLRGDFDRLLGSSNGTDVDELLRDTMRTEAALAIQRVPTNSPPAEGRPNTREGTRAMAVPAYHDRPGVLGWAFVLVVVAVTVLLAWRTAELRGVTLNGASFDAPTVQPEVDFVPEVGTLVSKPAVEVNPDLERLGLSAFAGTLRPGLPEGVVAQLNEGALIVEAGSSAAPVTVFVDGQEVGGAPVTVAVPEGRHEVAFLVHDDVRYRFTYVHPGKSRILTVP